MLEGKVVVVTGGASGIGRAIAQTMADSGAHLVIADLDALAADRAAANDANWRMRSWL